MAGQFVTVDRLWQGESGQAPWQRRIGTVESATNIRFDPRLSGAVTRNQTDLIADLLPDSSHMLANSATHFWTNIRGAVIAIGIGGQSDSSSVLAWDILGQPLSIIDVTTGGFDTYLASVVNPVRDIDVTTSFDTMIVCNRNRVIPATTQAYTFEESYNLLLNGDITAGTAIDDRTDEEQQFLSDVAELVPLEGDIFRVEADENLDPAGFYVKFTATRHADYPPGYFPQHGDYYRIPDGNSANPQESSRYDDTEMPHRIIYNEAAGTVTLATCPWRQRVSGNQASNPTMLFELRRIRSVEFFNSRLFLIGDNSVNSSRSNDFFNIFKDSVNAPNDSDPIRQLITQSDVGEALRAKTCGAALFLLAENGQLQYGATSENLTNVNGILETITDLPACDIDPATGPTWVSFLDEYGDIHQYAWSGSNRNILYQDMLTAHVPAMFDDMTVDRIFQFGTSFFAVVNNGDTKVNDIFVHGGSRVQSAWGTFQMRETPVYFNAWQGNIRVVTHDDIEGFTLLSYIHRLIPPPAGMTYSPRSDRQEIVPIASMSYDAALDRTTVPHTGRSGDATKSVLITRDVGATHEMLIPIELDSNGDPVFPGKRNDADQFLGFLFDNGFVLSKLFPGASPLGIRLMNLHIYHFDTTNYEVLTTQISGKEWSEKFHGGRVGQLKAGEVPFATGIKKCGMSIDPRSSTIEIRSSSAGQMIISQLSYELKQEGQSSEV